MNKDNQNTVSSNDNSKSLKYNYKSNNSNQKYNSNEEENQIRNEKLRQKSLSEIKEINNTIEMLKNQKVDEDKCVKYLMKIDEHNKENEDDE